MRYKFTDKELDNSTDLYFYEARYYDAHLARFISADTIVPDPSDPQAFNRYAYTLNNPIRYNDPSGHYVSLATQGVLASGALFAGSGLNAGNPFGLTFGVSPSFHPGISQNLASISQINQVSTLSGGFTANNSLSYIQQTRYFSSSFSTQFGQGCHCGTIGRVFKDAVEYTPTPQSLVKGLGTIGIWASIKFGVKDFFKDLPNLFGRKSTTGGSQTFERVISNAELKATQKTGLLRGGREGENFFTNKASLDAKRAQQRLGLDGPLRDSRIQFKIKNNIEVTGPRSAAPGSFGTAGGGREFSTNGRTEIEILRVDPLKR